MLLYRQTISDPYLRAGLLHPAANGVTKLTFSTLLRAMDQRTSHPGGRYSYHRLLWLACIPLGFWVLWLLLPVCCSVLVIFILLSQLPALG